MGDERLSSGARSHASAERLASGTYRSEVSIPLVLLGFHSVLSSLRSGVVSKLAHCISNPPGHERRPDGADGADDDSAHCGKPYGACGRLCGFTRHAGTDPGAH